MKEVSLEIDCSVRVETDLKRMGYCSVMLPLAFCSPELLCHALYNGNLVYHINECTCMRAYVEIQDVFPIALTLVVRESRHLLFK